MKESAVDCIMNDPDNKEASKYAEKGESFSCFQTDVDNPDVPMFYPDIPTDKLLTSQDVAAYMDEDEDKEKKVGDVEPKKPYRVLKFLPIRRKGEEQAKKYSISVNPEDSTKYYLFDEKDIQQVHAVGQIEKDPVTPGKYRGVVFYDEKIKVK